jgi:hypothetical protein
MSQSRSSSGGGDGIAKSVGAAAAGYTLAHAAVHVVVGTACTAACAPIALIGAAVVGIAYLASE